jgi:hypothetical protein
LEDQSTINIEPWPFRRTCHAQLQLLAAHEKPAVFAWDVIYQNRVDVNGTPLDGGSDDDFSAATRLLREDGIPVVFAAVSGPDPTGDHVEEAGLSKPLINIEGSIGSLNGDPELTMPFPGLREHGFLARWMRREGRVGLCARCPCWCAWERTCFPR